MSAFMVEDKTINRVVTHVFTNGTYDTLRRLNAECATPGEPIDEPMLGAMLFSLNIQGVNARYGEGQAKEFRDLDYRYQYEHATPIQVLKSLQCWIYQCSEGDVPDTLLYQIMKEYEHMLADSIISKLPAYNAAEWG